MQHPWKAKTGLRQGETAEGRGSGQGQAHPGHSGLSASLGKPSCPSPGCPQAFHLPPSLAHTQVVIGQPAGGSPSPLFASPRHMPRRRCWTKRWTHGPAGVEAWVDGQVDRWTNGGPDAKPSLWPASGRDDPASPPSLKHPTHPAARGCAAPASRSRHARSCHNIVKVPRSRSARRGRRGRPARR